MRAIDLLGGSEVIGKDDCWELLETAHIGRLVATVGGRVEIFPVNYALEGETILFRTNAGRKMRAALGIEVVFEVDDVDPTIGRTYRLLRDTRMAAVVCELLAAEDAEATGLVSSRLADIAAAIAGGIRRGLEEPLDARQP